MKVYVLKELGYLEEPDVVHGVFATLDRAKALLPRRQKWNQDGMSWFSWGRNTPDYLITEHEVHE